MTVSEAKKPLLLTGHPSGIVVDPEKWLWTWSSKLRFSSAWAEGVGKWTSNSWHRDGRYKEDSWKEIMKSLINRAGKGSRKKLEKIKAIMTLVLSQVDKMAQLVTRHSVTFCLIFFLLQVTPQVSQSFFFLSLIWKLWVSAWNCVILFLEKHSKELGRMISFKTDDGILFVCLWHLPKCTLCYSLWYLFYQMLSSFPSSWYAKSLGIILSCCKCCYYCFIALFKVTLYFKMLLIVKYLSKEEK